MISFEPGFSSYPARMISALHAVLLGLALLFCSGCETMENVEPIIFTLEVQNIGNSSASLGAELADMGGRNEWVYGFVWSETAFPNIATATIIDLGKRANPGMFSVLLSGLSPDTQYHYRSWVADPEFSRIFYGGQQSFKTLP